MGEVAVRAELTNAIHKHTRETPLTISLDCLVDTGAVMVLLPQEVAERLELPLSGSVVVRLADERRRELRKAGPVNIRIGERDGNFDCLIGPPNCEPLLGQIVLEQLDLIVDPANRQLVVRPESPFLPLVKLK